MIEFWAPWCKPCKKMTPRIRRLSIIFKGKVAFGKINTQSNIDISKRYNIKFIPHFGFFRYGKQISSMSGIKSTGEIKKRLMTYKKI